jgi:hypothetical protein
MRRTFMSKMRRRWVIPALAVGASLTLAATASAATVATVNYQATNGNGNPGVVCTFFCGTADVPGHGTAFWSFNSPNGPTPVAGSSTCADYVGTSTFVFADGTQLVLNENEEFCQPNGGDTPNYWNVTPGHPWVYGHPGRSIGKWTVCTPKTADPKGTGTGCGARDANGRRLYSSGPFANWTGNGTDELQTDGAMLTATWSGAIAEG